MPETHTQAQAIALQFVALDKAVCQAYSSQCTVSKHSDFTIVWIHTLLITLKPQLLIII